MAKQGQNYAQPLEFQNCECWQQDFDLVLCKKGYSQKCNIGSRRLPPHHHRALNSCQMNINVRQRHLNNTHRNTQHQCQHQWHQDPLGGLGVDFVCQNGNATWTSNVDASTFCVLWAIMTLMKEQSDQAVCVHRIFFPLLSFWRKQTWWCISQWKQHKTYQTIIFFTYNLARWKLRSLTVSFHSGCSEIFRSRTTKNAVAFLFRQCEKWQRTTRRTQESHSYEGKSSRERYSTTNKVATQKNDSKSDVCRVIGDELRLSTEGESYKPNEVGKTWRNMVFETQCLDGHNDMVCAIATDGAIAVTGRLVSSSYGDVAQAWLLII